MLIFLDCKITRTNYINAYWEGGSIITPSQAPKPWPNWNQASKLDKAQNLALSSAPYQLITLCSIMAFVGFHYHHCSYARRSIRWYSTHTWGDVTDTPPKRCNRTAAELFVTALRSAIMNPTAEPLDRDAGICYFVQTADGGQRS